MIDSNGIMKIKSEGITVSGNFVDYKPHGTVLIEYKNGETFQGEVWKGLHHGFGLVQCPNGIKFAC